MAGADIGFLFVQLDVSGVHAELAVSTSETSSRTREKFRIYKGPLLFCLSSKRNRSLPESTVDFINE